MNDYGLNHKYFEDVIKREFGHGLSNYRPDEFARVCLRMAKTASPETLLESEFINRPYENKLKSDAVRDCSEQNFIDDEVIYMMMQNYANKLERGEV
jgi:hypothetical protein